ncbi:histidine-type phosphatase [Microbacterium sp. ARD32]|uniref:histidine-type phosphatase n=1 Tax=Microbacterium sp. ARD32 TaxID=2962577 RepID=UPI002881250A|nr:histidine-type phosphatase [Microbacterium sp. ARD32]MDT0158128.1 histidine-type phosphatase [Microbacterium sp. ARD32]
MSTRSRRLGRSAAVMLVGVALAGCSVQTPAAEADPGTPDPSPSPTARTNGNLLGTKAVYEPFQDASTYQQAPEGYEPVLVEHVGRHGSRLLSSKKYDDLLWQLWQIAEKDGGLTELGEKFGADLQKVIAVHEKIGYGSLSARGAEEHKGIARRVVDRMRPLFDSAVADGNPISIVSSGVDRAVDSADSFVAGLEQEDPDLASVIQPQAEDKALLYFHDSDPAYLEYEDSEQLESAEDALEEVPEIATAARDVVGKLFTPEFVKRIDDGEFDLVDSGKGKKHLESVVDAGSYVYELYVIAPGMAQDADVDMSAYMSDEDAAPFALLSDGGDFYKKGPAFEGSDVTYRMSHVLVDAFLSSVEAVAAGEDAPAAEFRFAHAEEIVPLAALLELPGSTKQQPDDQLFTYDDNPWRGAQVAPMAANIQWDVFRGASDDDIIVRMLYNEQETAFGGACEPMSEGSFFYTAEELSSCLADKR